MSCWFENQMGNRSFCWRSRASRWWATCWPSRLVSPGAITEIKRKALALLTIGIVQVTNGSLWITNQGQPQQMHGALNLTLFIPSSFAVSFAVFVYGEIFNEDGSLQKSQINGHSNYLLCRLPIFIPIPLKQLDFRKQILATSKTSMLMFRTKWNDADIQLTRF